MTRPARIRARLRSLHEIETVDFRRQSSRAVIVIARARKGKSLGVPFAPGSGSEIIMLVGRF